MSGKVVGTVGPQDPLTTETGAMGSDSRQGDVMPTTIITTITTATETRTEDRSETATTIEAVVAVGMAIEEAGTGKPITMRAVAPAGVVEVLTPVITPAAAVKVEDRALVEDQIIEVGVEAEVVVEVERVGRAAITGLWTTCPRVLEDGTLTNRHSPPLGMLAGTAPVAAPVAAG